MSKTALRFVAIRGLWISVILIILGTVAYAFMYSFYAEDSNVRQGSLAARLLIPSEIRALDLPESCAPITYSRRYIECGGVCGTSYRIVYGTHATKNELEMFIQEQTFKPTLQFTDIYITLDVVPQNCPEAIIFLDSDQRYLL